MYVNDIFDILFLVYRFNICRLGFPLISDENI